MKFSSIVQKLGDAAIKHSLNDLSRDVEITGVAAVDEATRSDISYIEGPKFAYSVKSTNAGGLILPLDEQLQAQAQARGIVWIATANPRLLFAQTISLFYQPWHPSPSIHPSAVIHPTAKIGKDVYIGSHVVIQPNVEIGDGVCIHPNVVIYPEVKIGDRTILHANCSIHERTRIGDDCVIHSGAVIGGEGFGFVPTKNGWLKMEQSGITVLEDRVNVGSNSAIDRPAVGETRIGRDTVLDNLVQVGHGCQVGYGCALAGQVAMAGGVKVGNRVILGGQVGVANQVKIGDGAIAGAKAGIHSDVPPGETVSGLPAVPHKQFLKVSAILGRLPDMYQSWRKLQRTINLDD